MNRELSDIQTGFRKGRGTRDQIANIHWIIEEARELKKKQIYFCFIDYAKDFVWIATNWEILKEKGIPDHLTCLTRNLYAGQKKIVELNMELQTNSKLGKECVQACILSPVYLTYM